MTPSTKVANPPRERPLFVFDGECGFCRRSIVRFEADAGAHVDFAPSQDVGARFPEIGPEGFERAAQLIETDGTVRSGAAAVFRLLAYGGAPLFFALYERLGGFAIATDWGYRLVATHRVLAAKAANLFVGRDLRKPTFHLTRWIFFRLLGVAALSAFISFGRQARALVGTNGITPAIDFVAQLREAAREHHWSAFELYRTAPTLYWLAPSDRTITVLVAVGIAASVALIVDVIPALAIALIWVTYLSIVTIGSVFMGYQWDALLLETCVVALFLAPWRIAPKLVNDASPSTAGLWLLRLLVFKLMFLSGVVKQTSGDPTWANLTALDFHYWTQPLPTWTSWYVNRLPHAVHSVCTWLVLFVETYVPVLVFIPRTPRYVAFGLFALLQILIAATGNYGFFNLLAFALAIVLLDDRALAKFGPRGLREQVDRLMSRARRTPRRVKLAVPLAAVIAFVSAIRIVATVDPTFEAPPPFGWIEERIAPLASVNSYGLFAVMTTERHEIEVEGSLDGVVWHPYRFQWKPGADVNAKPRFDVLGMPRLDWQMWFAALGGGCDRSPWYVAFVARLLAGSHDVDALLADDPFPLAPPVYVRSREYDVHFTDGDERRASGAWWKRDLIGQFCPTLKMQGGQLEVARGVR